MSGELHSCSVCGRRFKLKFNFQAHKDNNAVNYFCTQACQIQAMMRAQRSPSSRISQQGTNIVNTHLDEVTCTTCQQSFVPRFAFQQVAVGQQHAFFCSMACRAPAVQNLQHRVNRARYGPRRIAVLNQKGGTGKTTTTVNLAAGLAKAGMRTLVIDMDAQGHVGISLGVKNDLSLYYLIVEDIEPQRCITPCRDNLDIIISSDKLAAAEIFLARMETGRERILRSRLESIDQFDFILLDCGPSISLLNMNALTFADSVIVPVSCDFLSLVGVKQILKTIKNVNQHLLHPVSIMGILPTFFDRRNKISTEAVNTLKAYFKDKVLPPIRINTRLREAPGHKQTIFEYDASSNGARDYLKLVQWLLEHTGARQRVA